MVVGVENTLLEFIMFCVESAKLYILWNGKKLPAFSLARELRHDDPLSPYLSVVLKFNDDLKLTMMML